ncbi:hypothetical protein [Acidithrix sp. C25]|nr:hypothetical protein [Acidithrix sp. C25]
MAKENRIGLVASPLCNWLLFLLVGIAVLKGGLQLLDDRQIVLREI